jgi:hypothetical protein
MARDSCGGDDDDSDVEVALVCPSQNLGSTYDGGEKPGRAGKGKDDSYFSIQQMKQRLYAQTCECLMPSIVLIIVLGGCVLSFFFCRECLLGILVLSACLCPWIPYFNIPLWVSIGMLVVLGFHFTNKVFTFMWE